MAWALIAHSAIEAAGTSGIMAASHDIIDHIREDDIGMLSIFPTNSAPGFYVWRGTMEQAFSGEGGTWRRCVPEEEWIWISHNGFNA